MSGGDIAFPNNAMTSARGNSIELNRIGLNVNLKYEMFYNILFQTYKFTNNPLIHPSGISSVAESCFLNPTQKEEAINHLQSTGNIFY